ncbi:MAG: hypothetical protein LAO51_05295 [Acidobacteriia bacterium]|nr:hypothetical protein [Terriglobia bacterium]
MTAGVGLTFHPAAIAALGCAAAIAAVASALLLYSGALERRGLVAESRALARRAGLSMAAGTLLEIPSVLVLLLRMPPAARGTLLGGDETLTWLFAAGLAAAIGAGAAGLLAGLSGKPRPACSFAAALLLCAAAASVLLRLRL